MIWAAPVALAGLAFLSLPVLIHLMGLGRARTRQFPSLRFLEGSRLLPSRRTRIHDALLLAVRLVVLAAAVAALGRPLVTSGTLAPSTDGRSVAIIVDTSASMRRASAVSGSSGSAATAARTTADSLAADATTALTILTDNPAREVAGAAAWLSLQSGALALTIISDFQIGSIVAGALAAVPPNVAVRAVRVRVDARQNGAGNVETAFEQGGGSVAARATVADGRTQISWSSSQRSVAAPPNPQTTRLVASRDQTLVDAARRAALLVGRPVGDSSAITIAYPGAPGRADLVRNGQPLRTTWQGDAVQRLRADSLLAIAADDASPLGEDSLPAGAAIVARARSGEPIVAALAKANADDNSLLLLLRAAPASPVSVALYAAVARIEAPSPAELDPAVLSDSAVRSLERAAGSALVGAAPLTESENAPSYARWFWIAALVALAGEAMLRRALTSKPTPAVVSDVAR